MASYQSIPDPEEGDHILYTIDGVTARSAHKKTMWLWGFTAAALALGGVFATAKSSSFKSALWSQNTIDSDVESQWEKFKVDFGRTYSTPEEESYRKSMFISSVDEIDRRNALHSKSTNGITQFADWTQEEFMALQTLYVPPEVISASKEAKKNKMNRKLVEAGGRNILQRNRNPSPTSHPVISPTNMPIPAPTHIPTAPTQSPVCARRRHLLQKGGGRTDDDSLFSTDDECEPTAMPTTTSSAEPTTSPIPAPTPSPTTSPTSAPTTSPTSSPPSTSPTTSAPTTSPTTSAPTTSSPTVNCARRRARNLLQKGGGGGTSTDDEPEPDDDECQPTGSPTLSPTLSPTMNVSSIFDYCAMGMCTAVKNQGNCGSCWAFATAEVVESAALIAGVDIDALSTQQMVDCDTSSSGCNGGSCVTAIYWVAGNGGLATDEDYPYTATDGTCDSSIASELGTDVDNMVYDYYASVDELKELVLNDGTFAVYVEVTNPWYSYTGGVITNEEYECDGINSGVNHGVQLTGWNDDENYWILRNSWGDSWGDGGFMYLEMYDANGDNAAVCAMTVYNFGATYTGNPTVE